MTNRVAWLVLVSLLQVAVVSTVQADEVTVARQRFTDGTDLVRKAQWAEALAAFEDSYRLRAHSITLFNIGACERALGRYTRARAMFTKAISLHESSANKMPESLLSEARGIIAEIDRLLARVTITLDPSDALFAVDGRPAEVVIEGPDAPRLVAGTLEPGIGRAPPAKTFELVLDPGAHVLSFARKGFSDAIVNATFTPGAVTQRKITLDLLPATINVTSNQPGAAVFLDGIDVGAAPLAITRPSGKYALAVKKRGFVTHSAGIELHAGQELNLSAPLSKEKTSIVKKWWFWTAAGVVLTGAALGTYFGVKASQEPTLDGGGLGWVANVR